MQSVCGKCIPLRDSDLPDKDIIARRHFSVQDQPILVTMISKDEGLTWKLESEELMKFSERSGKDRPYWGRITLDELPATITNLWDRTAEDLLTCAKYWLSANCEEYPDKYKLEVYCYSYLDKKWRHVKTENLNN